MNNKKFKIVTLLGIRPDIIRMFKLIGLLDEHQQKYGYEHVYAHTGQHFDHELDQIFYEQLGVRRPDINLGVGKILKEQGGATTFEHQMAVMFPKITELVEKTKPDAIMYLGDTNSVLSSVVAARLNVPVIHLEAGGRSFDWRMPEEKCRTVIDHLSDLLYCYTARHRDILLSEGVADFRLKVIGNIIYDAVEKFLPVAEKLKILEEYSLIAGKYVLVTLHREENTGDQQKLAEKVSGLIELAKDNKVLWPIMPRVAGNLKKFGLWESLQIPNIIFTKPLGYLEFLKLQKDAELIITDSGTVQEEALILGVPALISRRSTERPETIMAGASVLSDEDLYENAQKALELPRTWDRQILNPGGKSPSELVFADLMEKIQNNYFTTSRQFGNLQQNRFAREAYGIFNS